MALAANTAEPAPSSAHRVPPPIDAGEPSYSLDANSKIRLQPVYITPRPERYRAAAPQVDVRCAVSLKAVRLTNVEENTDFTVLLDTANASPRQKLSPCRVGLIVENPSSSTKF